MFINNTTGALNLTNSFLYINRALTVGTTKLPAAYAGTPSITLTGNVNLTSGLLNLAPPGAKAI